MRLDKRWLAAIVVVGILLIALVFEPTRYLSLDYLKSRQAALVAEVNAAPLAAAAIGFAIYALVTALSIPGAAVLTLAAGAVFGLFWGTLLVSFASSIGATLAFLLARYLLRGLVQARFGHRLASVNRGVRNDGPIYLLTLRLIPVIPFFLINLLMALTPISTRQFYLYSQLGMLPATVVFVNAGTQLATIDSLGDIASFDVLLALGLLALLPLLARLIAAIARRRRFVAAWPPPTAVDRNVIVIGAGSAGLVASLIAATVRARVTLVESGRMGGDCLNSGCVPSKALLRVAREVHERRTRGLVSSPGSAGDVDFAAVMRRVHEVIDAIAPHDSVERYRALGVECIQGRARVVSPWEVEVDGQRLATRAIVIATGARPQIPPLPGLDDIGYLTSDNVWELTALPRRLLVLGGGPIGCELAQAFARLGSQVTVVEMAERLLPREDPQAGELLAHVFAAEGITLALHCRAERFSADGDTKRVSVRSLALGDAESFEVEFDEVLLALGRTPNTRGFGLEELNLLDPERGTLEVDDYLQTRLPTIYACGDVVGPWQFTHTASHQAWYAAVNALFGSPLKRFAVDHRAIPWCTFTDPEIARVGLSESEAAASGIACEVTTYALEELDRAIA
ncbi:MAG: FAD-dependent oxidoreductase, partial [Gammaproteobacteria bacterium]